ncbi:MAG TPA: hypothetical protein VIS57_08655 [Xanthomonadales bacterium]
MKNPLNAYLFALVLSAVPFAVSAQEYDYHPALSDTFNAYLGAMRSSNSFKIEADDLADRSDEIDFNDRFDVSNHSTFFNGQLRWKFGSEKKWSLWGQYFSNKATGRAQLDEDVDWEDLTFQKGTYAEAGVKLAVTRAFFGRSFFKNDQNDFGLGIGIHNLDISAYIEGEVKINDGTSEVRYAGVGANQILPNVGGWYNYSPGRNWLLHGRVDWISATIGDYDGGLWNATAGVRYQAWRHVGFDLSWQYFDLHLKVDSDDWKGRTKMTYSGPVLALVFGW